MDYVYLLCFVFFYINFKTENTFIKVFIHTMMITKTAGKILQQ